MSPRRLTADAYVDGIVAGDRGVLARAITLVESTRVADQRVAEEVLERVMPRTGRAARVGVSGVPGVGKSTFLETLGIRLVDAGRRVAVLAVDPSSSITGGSILGDKSRMNELAGRDAAFIRPSPSARTLGGVARRTREAMLLCEAAGFDVVLVETVGVGQSETAVADMVDVFLVLLLPGAGDELQGIKRGIVELADRIAVNKADGDNEARAREAVAEYGAALRYLAPRADGAPTQVVAISARTGAGVDDLWASVETFRAALDASGALARRRAEQARGWLWSIVDERLRASFRRHPEVAARAAEVEAAVVAGTLPVSRGARVLLDAWGSGDGGTSRGEGVEPPR